MEENHCRRCGQILTVENGNTDGSKNKGLCQSCTKATDEYLSQSLPSYLLKICIIGVVAELLQFLLFSLFPVLKTVISENSWLSLIFNLCIFIIVAIILFRFFGLKIAAKHYKSSKEV